MQDAQLTDDLEIISKDNHLFEIRGFNSDTNPSCPYKERYGAPAIHTTLLFQSGAIKDVGRNGVTHEALLLVLMARMKAFQDSPTKCIENELALAYLGWALHAMRLRTKRREMAGIVGTHTEDGRANPTFEGSMLEWFNWRHLPPHLARVSAPVADLALALAGALVPCVELEEGLRKLLEAKDCFVRAAIVSERVSQREKERQEAMMGEPVDAEDL